MPISVWKHGKLAGQPTGPAGLLTIRHAHSALKVRNGGTETVTETVTDER